MTVVLLLLSAFLSAQFRVGVQLVNVVATVVDGKGRLVPNLAIDDFIVEEDGQPQRIEHLLPTADLPVSIGVVLYSSESMRSKMRTAQRAIDRFFSTIHRDDEIFLMTFAMQASLIVDFTADRTRLTNALLTGVNVGGGTALYDSLDQALQKVKQGRYQKKVVLLVTDGEDTTSLTRFDKVLQHIREAEMLVYSVGIKGAPGFDMGTDPLSGNSRSSTPNNTSVDMKVLNRFGEASGGSAWEISEAAFGKNMDAVLDTIAAELRSQYSIGYYPNRPAKDGKWHSVRIRVKNPDYVARGRKEYFDMGAMPVAAPPAAPPPPPPPPPPPRDLQSLGLKVVFSSELVRPDMRVVAEPKSTALRKILDEVLAPHGLRAAAGPKDTWLVVQAPEAATTAASVTINGRVDTGADRTPVAGAAIEAIGTSGPGERRTITDAAGRFEMEAAPGALRLEVTAKGFLTQRVDLTVVAGMSAIEIVLPRAGGQRAAPGNTSLAVLPARGDRPVSLSRTSNVPVLGRLDDHAARS
jgi:Ca-activated chloride channel family protein